MAPEKHKAVATLDSEELSLVRRLFKNGDVKSDGRISVAEVVACVEKMDFIVDRPLEDLVQSVVPAAVEVDRLSLNDAMKVASAAKAQDKGSTAPPKAQSLGREDSLAELESSFIKQVMSGEIAADIIEEEPKAPPQGLGREDSLAELQSSFKNQAISGNIPAAIVEAPEDSASALPPNIVAVPVDIPKRRQSVTGGYPAAPSSPRNTARGQVKREGALSAMAGPEPVVVNDLPKRRASVTRPGGGSLAGLRAESVPGTGIYDDDSSTMPATPQLMKQSSEMQLLESAGSLSVEAVEVSSVPKKRRSFTVSQSWLEAAAQESAKALEAKKLGEAQRAEAERQRAEAEKTRAEVAAYLSRLTDQVDHNAEIAQAKEEAERRERAHQAERQRAEAEKARAEVAACLSRLTDQVDHNAEIVRAKEEAERRERAAALEVERAEAAAARTEVETVLRLLVESLERDAAVAEAREEAERLVQREAEARQAAETKAADAAERAEKAARARQEEDRVKEERAEAAAARTEVETSLLLLVESLERDAAVAEAREEAERLIQREAKARQAAETKAAEAAEKAEEAARVRHEEDKVKEEARRALQAEAELLRSKLQEAGEEAAERALEEAQARAHKEAQELRQAEEQAKREAGLVEEARTAAKREAEAKEAADRDAKSWEEKFQALQREREEEARRAKEELARAIEDAREFERDRDLARRAAEARRGCGVGGGGGYCDGGDCATVALVVPQFLWKVSAIRLTGPTYLSKTSTAEKGRAGGSASRAIQMRGMAEVRALEASLMKTTRQSAA
eukprot:g8828.t1